MYMAVSVYMVLMHTDKLNVIGLIIKAVKYQSTAAYVRRFYRVE